MYSIEEICEVINGKFVSFYENVFIDNLVYDSRHIRTPSASLFFALVTAHNDGHKYLEDAYKKGIKNFIISEEGGINLHDVNLIRVSNTLDALQTLAAHHRKFFSFPVIGITGSNGKTIVKEWLYQLLNQSYHIVRSPKSFNSQIGVPLSVWLMNDQHNLALVEAGISRPGEMEKLERIIRPQIGILTNIGEAHDEHFSSEKEKISEKLKLFADATTLIIPHHLARYYNGKAKLFSWGSETGATLRIISIQKEKSQTGIRANYGTTDLSLTIPFTDDASIQNAISCWCCMLYFKIESSIIINHFKLLHAVNMRLQLEHSINDCLVVNDSYSADLTSLKIALDFLQQQSSGLKKTMILSEFVESGRSDKELYAEIIQLIKGQKIEKVIVIGEKIAEAMGHKLPNEIAYQTYLSTNDFIHSFRTSLFYREIILIKGARKFEFEKIARLFEKKLHETVLEINLNALSHNLKTYQALLKPGVKIMAMVKAFSYGSGGAEIASVLQFHHTDFLGVAYADEGADLVTAGIQLPIMVMNTEVSSFQSIADHNLQPVIYSFDILRQFEKYLEEQGLSFYPVHVEIETGMNRLGFSADEIERLALHIRDSSRIKIVSVFTHLAASEDPHQDEFTNQQSRNFQEAITVLEKNIDYAFLKHISNSAAMVRHQQLQMDMVRLGIGVYGIETDNKNALNLQAVATLRSTIAQLKKIRKGESVSYNRKGIVERDSLVATVRIGYADGYSRRFGDGIGKMLVQDRLAPVIGTVCMDMTMIDVTDIPGVKEGDEVIIFGPELPVQNLALWAGTIPYEIMTGISQRVKRIYFHEG